MVYIARSNFKFNRKLFHIVDNCFGCLNVVCVVLLLLVTLSHCCTNLKRDSKIRIEKNGYVDIVVGIEEGVREDLFLIERIKETFTEASQLLFNITK
jgi:hypothetical protein